MPSPKPDPDFPYDPACEVLAEHFLTASPLNNVPDAKESLAQAIQNAVGDWYLENDLGDEDADHEPEATHG